MAEADPNVEELKRLLRRLEKIERLAGSEDAASPDGAPKRGLASLRTPLPKIDPLAEAPSVLPPPPLPDFRLPDVRPRDAALTRLTANAADRSPTLAGARAEPRSPWPRVAAFLLGFGIVAGAGLGVVLGFGDKYRLFKDITAPSPERPALASIEAPPPAAPPALSVVSFEPTPATAAEASAAPAAESVPVEASAASAKSAAESPAPSVTADAASPVTSPAASSTAAASSAIADTATAAPVTPQVLAPPPAGLGDVVAKAPPAEASPAARAAPPAGVPLEAPPVVASAPSTASGPAATLAGATAWIVAPGNRLALPVRIEPPSSAPLYYVLVNGLEPDALITTGMEVVNGTWLIRGPDLGTAEIVRATTAAPSSSARIELRALDGIVVAQQMVTLVASEAAAAAAAAAPPAPPAPVAPVIAPSVAPAAPPPAVAPVVTPPAETRQAAASIADKPAITPAPDDPYQSDAQKYLRRGLLMLDSGNVNGARLLLERAADLGSGAAAFSLGRTFDPATARLLGNPLINADRAAARRWYEKAAALGISEARERLDQLARE